MPKTPVTPARDAPGKRKRGRDKRLYESVRTKTGWRWKYVVPGRNAAVTFRQAMVIADARDLGKIGRKRDSITLPRVYADDSTIPGAGRGLFVATAVPAGGYITEYGGKLIDLERFTNSNYANMPNTDHFLSMEDGGMTYDGKITDKYTEAFYRRNHLMGAFANDSTGVFPINATVKFVDIPTGYHVPKPPNAPGLAHYSRRAFLTATKNIPAHGEVFLDYGELSRQRMGIS